jgi:myo-inositol-1(or 4)-monophosphatase
MQDFKKVAIKAAKLAGKYLLNEYEHFDRSKIEVKSHGQILTRADMGSENFIISEIKAAFPEHAILSEESGENGLTCEYLWIIDPIDGTTNFSFHNPLWSISIGLAHNSEIILGLVYAPKLGELYVAEKGKGATLNGKEIHVSNILNERAIHTFCHGGEKKEIEKAMKYAKNQKEDGIDCRQLGSAAIEMAYVACGRIESITIPGVKPWDVAAGVLLVREAGGVVSDFEGQYFNLKSKDVVGSNGIVHNEILKVIN